MCCSQCSKRAQSNTVSYSRGSATRGAAPAGSAAGAVAFRALFELLAPGAESVAHEEVQQALAVHCAQRQRIQPRPARHLGRQIAIGAHGHQPPAGGQPVQRLAQVVADGALDVGRRGDHAVERAVFGQPLDSRLRADLVHAGHVVHRVADQRQVVDDALGRHAELGLHGLDVQHLRRLGHGVDQRDLGRDQLRQVLVAGGDQHLVATGRGHGAPACRWRRRPRCPAPPAPASRAGAPPRGWARSAAPAPRASARAAPCTRHTSRRGRSAPWRRRHTPHARPGSARAATSSSPARRGSPQWGSRPARAGRAGRGRRGTGSWSRPPAA